MGEFAKAEIKKLIKESIMENLTIDVESTEDGEVRVRIYYDGEYVTGEY